MATLAEAVLDVEVGPGGVGEAYAQSVSDANILISVGAPSAAAYSVSDAHVGFPIAAPSPSVRWVSDALVLLAPKPVADMVSDAHILSVAQIFNPAPVGSARLPMRGDFTAPATPETPFTIAADESGSVLGTWDEDELIFS